MDIHITVTGAGVRSVKHGRIEKSKAQRTRRASKTNGKKPRGKAAKGRKSKVERIVLKPNKAGRTVTKPRKQRAKPKSLILAPVESVYDHSNQ
jgi:hypothetical protein